MKNYKLDIIIPAYHEEDNIAETITRIEKHVKTPHFLTIVIQDRKDLTIPVIKKFKKKIEHIRILYTKDGIGMLRALKAGLLYSKSPIVVITMADLSDDQKDIDIMVKKIDEGYDFVCGSRYMPGGKLIGGPFLKRFLSYAGCKTLRFFTGIPTNDATNAFKCFRRSLLSGIKIESMEGFELPLELLVKAYKKGFKIAEIPTVWRDREKGSSKFKVWRNIRFYMRWYIYAIVY